MIPPLPHNTDTATPELPIDPALSPIIYTRMNRWERWVRIAHIEAERYALKILNSTPGDGRISGYTPGFRASKARANLVYVLGRLIAGNGVTPRTASPQRAFGKGVTQ